MGDLNREDLHRLAGLGAKVRLEELQREAATIRQAFPDLFGKRRPGAASEAVRKPVRRRRKMSAAARTALSERMKKYWAGRRKAKGQKKS